MKIVFLLIGLIALGGLIVGCAGGSKTDEEYALELSEVAPRPTAAMASRAGVSLEQIGIGYTVFGRKCLECHTARVPKNPADPNWHPIVEGMTWNAGLNPGEKKAVLTYLRAALR